MIFQIPVLHEKSYQNSFYEFIASMRERGIILFARLPVLNPEGEDIKLVGGVCVVFRTNTLEG